MKQGPRRLAGFDLTRRQFLVGGAMLTASQLLSSQSRAARIGRSPKFVFIILGGGLDAILTTNPKTRADVDVDVDLPYAPDAIVSAGDIQLGPHLAAMKPHAARLAITNGIQFRSVSHPAGYWQLERMRMGANQEMPTIAHIIGENRIHETLSGIQFGSSFTPGYFPSEILDALDQQEHGEIAQVAENLRDQQRTLAKIGDARTKTASEGVDGAAKLLERYDRIPRFVKQDWPLPPWSIDKPSLKTLFVNDAQKHSANFQRMLWTLEHDVCRSVTYDIYKWDTHRTNLRSQALRSESFFPMFARFLSELQTRRNARGTLASQTLVYLSSEFGRFPRLNNTDGKDHLPEGPMLLMGPGVRLRGNGTVYGATGKSMESLRVSPTTGRAASNGKFFDLNDVGATLLTLAGVEPQRYAHYGNVIRFLVDV